ncbi:MAG: pyridoxal-dependent decarboxylase [Micropepsaceae bacterium]
MTTSKPRSPFPAGGRHWDDLNAEMVRRSARDADIQGGRAPAFYFFAEEETYEIGKKAFNAYFSQNALGNKVFPGLQSMETDVLDYGLGLFSAPEGGHGIFSSGGSESIFLALKAAREAHRAQNKVGRETPLNIVVPITVHPAFDKAAIAMDLEVRRAALRPDRRVDPGAMRELIDENTMALVGSAPCFPHGVIDPIEDLSRIAVELGKWLHVDACVGGWIAPFFTRIGRSTPAFDFRFPGVRSISADLHKFGFCPKPASTVFFRNREDAERSAFRVDAWPSGPFLTETLVGTRPGGAVSGAWAVLNHMGTPGFEGLARRLANMVDGYVAGIRSIRGLEMWSEPDVTIINYGSHEVNMQGVAKLMMQKGFLPSLTRAPLGLHAMLAMQHEPVRAQYLDALRDSVETVRTSGSSGTVKSVY